MLWKDNFKNERREWETIYFVHIYSKQKNNHFFLLPWVFQWFYALEKHIKPIITLKRLVGNRGYHSSCIMCLFQCKDSIQILSCAWSWNLLHSHPFSGFWVIWYIDKKHVSHLRKAWKSQNMKKKKKKKIILYQWRGASIEIPSIAFLKPNLIMKWFLH